MSILLDTHALLWWLGGADRVSRPASRAIASASTLFISTITCWEVGRLLAKGRISLTVDPYRWFEGVFEGHDVEAVAPTSRMALIAGMLPDEGFHGDPADSLIYATAKERGIPLVTKDARITEFARARRDVTLIW
ncbi:MAG TPA: type II toxin-antitoxin system VapC family toxin [Actinomycetota bacterium]